MESNHERWNRSAKKQNFSNQKRNLESSPHELFHPEWFEDWERKKIQQQETKYQSKIRSLESKIFGDKTNTENSHQKQAAYHTTSQEQSG